MSSSREMGSGRREVIWSDQAHVALDEAVAHVSQDSKSAAIRLLEAALDAGASLAERGRIVPEVASPSILELFVLKYRLMYKVTERQGRVLAFLHSARDFAKWQRGE